MTIEKVKQQYAQEPWGKLLIEFGYSPYDTESSARRVAEYAVEKIDRLKSVQDDLLASLQDLLQYIEGTCPDMEGVDSIETSLDEGPTVSANLLAARQAIAKAKGEMK
jgi:hypothetical protein